MFIPNPDPAKYQAQIDSGVFVPIIGWLRNGDAWDTLIADGSDLFGYGGLITVAEARAQVAESIRFRAESAE